MYHDIANDLIPCWGTERAFESFSELLELVCNGLEDELSVCDAWARHYIQTPNEFFDPSAADSVDASVDESDEAFSDDCAAASISAAESAAAAAAAELLAWDAESSTECLKSAQAPKPQSAKNKRKYCMINKT